jgi:hypothetical protein
VGEAQGAGLDQSGGTRGGKAALGILWVGGARSVASWGRGHREHKRRVVSDTEDTVVGNSSVSIAGLTSM